MLPRHAKEARVDWLLQLHTVIDSAGQVSRGLPVERLRR